MITEDRTPSGARRGAWRAFTVLAAGILVASLAFSTHFTSFLHAKELVLGVTLLLLACVGLRRGVDGFRGVRPLWPMILLFLLQGGLALVRPPRAWMPWSSAMLSFGLVLLMILAAGGVLGRRRFHRPLIAVLVLSATAVALLGLLQYTGLADALLPPTPGYTQPMYSVFGNQDLLGGYVAMGIALAVALMRTASARRRTGLAVALLVLCSALVASGSRSAWFAALVGVSIALPWRGPALRRVAVLLLPAGGMGLFFFGGIAWQRLAASFGEGDTGWRVRLWLWDGTLRMIRDTPFLGVGPGNFAYWSPRYLGEALLSPQGAAHYHNTIHTLHAHSEPLELIAETGLVGLVLMALMLWRLRRARGPAAGGLTALMVFACVNPAFHSAPHLLATGLLTVIVLWTPPAKPWRPCYAGSFAVLVAVFVGLHGAFVLAPSYLQARGEDAHLAGAAPDDAYGPWLRRMSAEAERCYAIALMEHGRYGEARQALLRARRGLDTGELYWCLAETSLALGRRTEARFWLAQCGARWPYEQPFRDLAAALENLPKLDAVSPLELGQ